MLHEAVVHEEILLAIGFPGVLGHADKTVDGNEARLAGNGEQLGVHTFPESVHNPLAQAGDGEIVNLVAVVHQGEGDLRGGQGHPQELVRDVAQLRGVGLQEFPPRRHVVEQILDQHVRSPGTIDVLLAAKLGIRNEKIGAQLVLLAPRPQLDFRHRGDGGQRLKLCPRFSKSLESLPPRRLWSFP